VLEHKTVDIDLDAKAADAGAATAYVAVFGNVDRDLEVISPGAFVNLDEFVKDGWIATNHDRRILPVASVTSAEQDAYGLKLTWEWHGTEDAQAARTVVRERLERGKGVKCSIGYRVLKSHPEQRDGGFVRVLDEVELYEASVVNLPANPKAEVTAVKAWFTDYEDAVLALKEGRTISTRNRTRLASMCQRMKEAVAEMETLLAETDPTPSGEDGWGEKPKSSEALRQAAAFEAFRARYPIVLSQGAIA
jgi:uncharacterized protein